MAQSFIDEFMADVVKADKEGVVTTAQEMKENQFGLQLPHYAQQYLFGSTGLRLRVFHSISGVPASCKSPLLFDLMGYICASPDIGGLGGLGFLYELEDKISPSLLCSMLSKYGDIIGKNFRVVQNRTIDKAIEHITKVLIFNYQRRITKYDVPLVVGMDSIGGAASADTVAKMLKEGAIGKGFYDKAHFMKYFCENMSGCMGAIPMVVICVNQEKEKASSTPGYSGPPQKQITGGVSQVFKDGHMISATFKTLASGDGKIITLRTTKTSFSDARKIEVAFRWNKFGTDENDYYGHHFEWALASAKCLADPDKGVGELRSIADVKVSDANLVTCPQLGCKSVKPEEFEQALFENKEVLNALYVYQKIDKIKGMDEYAEHIALLKKSGKVKEGEALPYSPKKTAKEQEEKTTPPPKRVAKEPKKTKIRPSDKVMEQVYDRYKEGGASLTAEQMETVSEWAADQGVGLEGVPESAKGKRGKRQKKAEGKPLMSFLPSAGLSVGEEKKDGESNTDDESDVVSDSRVLD